VRAFDRINRSLGPSSKLQMQRALTGTDFENPPAATNLEAVEQCVRHRIPQASLCPETRSFVLRVTEKIFVGSWQNVARTFSP